MLGSGRLVVVVFGVAVLSFFAGAVAHRYRDRVHDLMSSRRDRTEVLTEDVSYASNLHNLVVHLVTLPFDNGREGAIEGIGDRVLVAQPNGRFWVYERDRGLHPISLRAPVNAEAFEQDPRVPETIKGSGFGLDRYHTRFGVKDLLLQPLGDKFELYASHHVWNENQQCLNLVVSQTLLTKDAFAASEADEPDAAQAAPWKTVYASEPCLPLAIDGAYAWLEEFGGRLVMLPGRQLLISVGDAGFTGARVGPTLAQDPNVDYGKTIRINLQDGTHSIFTTGHRNPQGLTVTAAGDIYLTEHGPTGGDELNLLHEGLNYGWPFVSYGRGCSGNDCADDDGLKLTNPLNEHIGDHPGYQKPVYAWVPSIGISNVIEYHGDLFDRWRKDLLVTSLKQRTVYRVRTAEGRAVVVEPVLEVPYKIRDIVEMENGEIALLTDARHLGLVQPDLSRRRELVSNCLACHTFAEDGPNGIGPNLWGVAGRRIASAEGYDYSDALRARSDEFWSDANLDAFLEDTQAFASGTAMPPAGLMDAADRKLMVGFLGSLR